MQDKQIEKFVGSQQFPLFLLFTLSMIYGLPMFVLFMLYTDPYIANTGQHTIVLLDQ